MLVKEKTKYTHPIDAHPIYKASKGEMTELEVGGDKN